MQQALLLRLRDHALLGEVWAEKLLRKVVEAIPDRPSTYDPTDIRGSISWATALIEVYAEEQRKEAEGVPDPEKNEAVPEPVEPENDE